MEELYLSVSLRKQAPNMGNNIMVGLSASAEDFKVVGRKEEIIAHTTFHIKDMEDESFVNTVRSFSRAFPAKRLFIIVDKYYGEDGNPTYKHKVEVLQKQMFPTLQALINNTPTNW